MANSKKKVRKKGQTAKQVLQTHDKLKSAFEETQTNFSEAQAALKSAKSELVAFRERFGGIVKLFE